ncbi:RagB/SusD family nutrient uptake outer membrane protein [uncultured Algibacter sp.]|uniref:RagB/SusD family nutrient uptake outer membrane protein n=1 Tax=uncultured Algibacter sp. TaxID=298659 RepID=UPI003216866A
MKNLIYKVSYLLLFFAVFMSCSKNEFLDIDPQGIIIPSTVEDFRLLLDDEDLYSAKHRITPYASDIILLDDRLQALLAYTNEERNLYRFNEFIYSPTTDDSDWNTYYGQIFNINIVLDGLSKLEDGTPEKVEALVAEAKLHRAYAYFNLVNIYGLHYNPATASTDLGVPIREGFDFIGVDLTRASVQDVYDLVIDDISSSIANLRDTQSLEFSFRPSKAAAFALLSKVFLYQGKYQDALDNIEQALALNNTLRDINGEITNTYTADGQSVETTERYWPDIIEDSQVVWHKSVILDLAFIESYGNLFEDDDLRNQWMIPFQTSFDASDFVSTVPGYFLVATDNANSGTQGIYTSDMYLIRAECNARLGNIQQANDDLNDLREKRYRTGTHTDLNITNADQLLEFVKEERLREFPSTVERTFDIKRYNRFDNDNIVINHPITNSSGVVEETITVQPDSKNWAQPIGQLYIGFNPEIEQNPRD